MIQYILFFFKYIWIFQLAKNLKKGFNYIFNIVFFILGELIKAIKKNWNYWEFVIKLSRL